MPLVQLTVPHALSRAEARRQIEALVDDLQKQYGGRVDHVQKRWHDEVLTFQLVRAGMVINGSLTLKARVLNIELELPWSVALFASRLRQQFVEKAHQLLGAR